MLTYKIRRIALLVVIELRLYFKSGPAVWWTFLLPAILLWMLATLANTNSATSIGYLMGGSCSLVVVTAGLIGTSPYVVQMRERRVFEVFGLLGMYPGEIALGVALSRWILAVVQLVVMISIGGVLLQGLRESTVIARLPNVLLILTILSAVMQVIAQSVTLIAKSPAGSRAVASAVGYGLIFAGNTGLERVLPKHMACLVSLLPTYHIRRAFEWSLGSEVNWVNSILLMLILMIMFGTLNSLCICWRARTL